MEHGAWGIEHKEGEFYRIPCPLLCALYLLDSDYWIPWICLVPYACIDLLPM
jgi:hypothetical protein